MVNIDVQSWKFDVQCSIFKIPTRQFLCSTRIRLKDRAPGFTNPAAPKAMIWTGERPAQHFQNGLLDLTLDTGRGNSGAIGLQFIANNQGGIQRINIEAGDHHGLIGNRLAPAKAELKVQPPAAELAARREEEKRMKATLSKKDWMEEVRKKRKFEQENMHTLIHHPEIIEDEDLPPPGKGTGLSGFYFQAYEFQEPVGRRIDPELNMNWNKAPPFPGILPEKPLRPRESGRPEKVHGYSIRWSGFIEAALLPARNHRPREG